MTDQTQTTTQPVEAFESDLSLINSTPALLSLLYDANMLPEQAVDERDAISIVVACEAYRLGRTTPQPLSVGLDREAVAGAVSRWRRQKASHIVCQEMTVGDVQTLADAIIALAAPAEGYVLVPVEPTEAMVDGAACYERAERLISIYRAMIAAFLPAAPTGETGA